MTASSRRFCLVLALVIAFSHLALTVHAETHSKSVIDQCPLCLCQAQQSHGFPSIHVHIPALPVYVPDETAIPVKEWAPDLIRAYLQRGPPRLA